MRRFVVPVLLVLAACASEQGRHTLGLAYPNKACAGAAGQRVADATINGIPRAYSRRIFDDTYAGCVGQKSRLLVGSPPLPPP